MSRSHELFLQHNHLTLHLGATEEGADFWLEAAAPDLPLEPRHRLCRSPIKFNFFVYPMFIRFNF